MLLSRANHDLMMGAVFVMVKEVTIPVIQISASTSMPRVGGLYLRALPPGDLMYTCSYKTLS